ncbi:MAG: hypothetical protein GDA55_03415 [Cellvibrionales bacterium]|nr:hypothetical protein [Cellvibrionales bacterium]
MRRMLVFLAMALLLALVAYFGFGADSYLLVRTGETALQMSLWVGALLGGLLLGLLGGVWAVVQGVFLGGWRRGWRRRRLERLHAAALAGYADGDWARAHKLLERLAAAQVDSLPALLLAADAAWRAGKVPVARDIYRRALAAFPAKAHGIRLRLAHLERAAGELRRAADLCRQLLAERSSDPAVRLLEIYLAEERGDWPALVRLLGAARRQRVLAGHLPAIERRLLRLCLVERPAAPLLAALADLAGGSKGPLPSDLCIALAQQLALKGKPDKAERLLRTRIECEWDGELVAAFAQLEGKSAKGQLRTAEGWLAAHPDDRGLLQALHSLALRAEDPARATRYAQRLAAL